MIAALRTVQCPAGSRAAALCGQCEPRGLCEVRRRAASRLQAEHGQPGCQRATGVRAGKRSRIDLKRQFAVTAPNLPP